MLLLLLKSFVVYVLLIISVRLMGKREIGQLQPADLVITILISEIAVMPIENDKIPFLLSLSIIIFLVALEILMSFITLKFSKFRHIVQGNSLIVVDDGEIQQETLKKTRLTVDDIIEGMRLKDVFDISEVEYAFVETNGQLSVKIRDEKSPVTMEDMNIEPERKGIPFVIISDGRLISESLKQCCMTKEKLYKILENKNLKKEDILIMTADKKGITYLALKEKSKRGNGCG